MPSPERDGSGWEAGHELLEQLEYGKKPEQAGIFWSYLKLNLVWGFFDKPWFKCPVTVMSNLKFKFIYAAFNVFIEIK